MVSDHDMDVIADAMTVQKLGVQPSKR
jgi:hypothetical protein